MIPTPYTLRVRTQETGPDDDLGNSTSTWVERDWRVHSYVQGPATTEQLASNRDLSVIAYTVLAPAVGIPGEYDEVAVIGHNIGDVDKLVWHAVNGRPADYSHGPWVFPEAGAVVELRTANG